MTHPSQQTIKRNYPSNEKAYPTEKAVGSVLYEDIISLSRMAQIDLTAIEAKTLAEQMNQSKKSVDALGELICLDDTSSLIFQVQS